MGSDYDERQEALSSKEKFASRPEQMRSAVCVLQELVDGTALGELDVSTAAVESLQQLVCISLQRQPWIVLASCCDASEEELGHRTSAGLCLKSCPPEPAFDPEGGRST